MKENNLANDSPKNKLLGSFFFEKLWDQRFFHFILVGILNTAFSYILFALFIYLGLHFKSAVLVATTLGILFNFKSTGTLVFKNKKNSLLLKFFIVYSFIYFININVIKFFYLFLHNYYLAGAFCSILSPFLSFYLIRKFVFVGVKNEAN